MNFFLTAITLVLLQFASKASADPTSAAYNPANNSTGYPAQQPQNPNTYQPYQPAQGGTNYTNSTNTTIIEPTYISMNCTQAFMPLQADTSDNTTGPNSAQGTNYSEPTLNITEAGCKGFETPDGAYCRAESCYGLPKGNYFMPDINETVRQSLCTDAQSQSYSCTGACIAYATCEVCISMDDPALQEPYNTTNTTTNPPSSRRWK
ncbi:hypothetical protein CROQUDRAFT_674075 [Cronartium quercuum f. sp. fusiforme G11]|uniref:Secreted protein n=1 Tax=Cronartium quercuum f. sp. fusiforme G11 TaxID=708437 RepID=A0A9P6T736_9BASI|nr:hypothetical protein CROQUDRAFT_674075 [Cronartium quercuum f. sp. fusiforme G11]